jgi:hypothetical protein
MGCGWLTSVGKAVNFENVKENGGRREGQKFVNAPDYTAFVAATQPC